LGVTMHPAEYNVPCMSLPRDLQDRECGISYWWELTRLEWARFGEACGFMMRAAQ
jgi:hypothetical protein